MKERINIFSILLDAICCVMCADGEMSPQEQKTIRAILKKVKCPWTPEDLGKQITNFLQRVETKGLSAVTEETCGKLGEFKRRGKEYVLLKCINYMVTADDIVDQKELRICEKFKSALTDQPTPPSAKEHPDTQIEVAETLSVQNPNPSPDMPGKEDDPQCAFCKGSGLCSGCNGTGKRDAAGMIASNLLKTDCPKEPCFMCQASGTCNMCQGSGTK